jgi:hypothetical protein
MKGGADIFLAPKNSTLGSAVSIASAYPPAVSKPLCSALIGVVRETNGTFIIFLLYFVLTENTAKDAAAVEAKITAIFDEGNKARIAAKNNRKAEKDKKAFERMMKITQYAAIKAKVFIIVSSSFF